MFLGDREIRSDSCNLRPCRTIRRVAESDSRVKSSQETALSGTLWDGYRAGCLAHALACPARIAAAVLDRAALLLWNHAMTTQQRRHYLPSPRRFLSLLRWPPPPPPDTPESPARLDGRGDFDNGVNLSVHLWSCCSRSETQESTPEVDSRKSNTVHLQRSTVVSALQRGFRGALTSSVLGSHERRW